MTDNPTLKKIPTRNEIPESDRWDLTILYKTVKDWQSAFDKLKEEFPKIKKFQGTLGRSAKDLLACFEFDRQLDLAFERLFHYSSLQSSEDSSNNDYLTREGMIQNLYTLSSEAGSFIRPEIMAIPDETFESFLKDPALTEWEPLLRRIHRFKPHTLSEGEERILALSGNSLGAVSEVFSQLTNVDMKFGIIGLPGGQSLELTQSTLSSFLYSRQPEVRKQAFHQFYKEIGDHRYSLAASLTGSVRADVFRSRSRNYSSSLEASLFPDAVPVSVYDNLISTVRKHLPVLYRYYEFRRKVLGLAEIHHYDTYVPMVGQIEKVTSFDQAIDLVLAALKPLSQEYRDTLSNGLSKQRWCDRYESKGKRSGAFSSSSYQNPPYILMNYKEDVFSDVYTLAHEAGHSMHSYFSHREQPYQDSGYPIFLAEVASTFNEELLTHHLLETTDEPMMRAYIINRQLDDIRGTIFRQTMFAEFEKNIHETEEKGEGLTLETYRGIYKKLLDVYFGPHFKLDEDLELECLRIPHFYNAFYVYKYATGMSAAISLSERVLHGGKKELEDYLGFLKSGCSRYPIETLARAGVDMSSAEPIEAALQLFGERLSELETLLKPAS